MTPAAVAFILVLGVLLFLATRRRKVPVKCDICGKDGFGMKPVIVSKGACDQVCDDCREREERMEGL